MKDETRGLYLAIILSMVVIFVTNWMFPSPEPQIRQDIEAPQEISAAEEPETLKENAAQTAARTP